MSLQVSSLVEAQGITGSSCVYIWELKDKNENLKKRNFSQCSPCRERCFSDILRTNRMCMHMQHLITDAPLAHRHSVFGMVFNGIGRRTLETNMGMPLASQVESILQCTFYPPKAAFRIGKLSPSPPKSNLLRLIPISRKDMYIIISNLWLRHMWVELL